MPKLNQIIAVVSGKKAAAQKTITEIHHKLQKSVLLEGIARQYKPRDEVGEQMPREDKRVQMRARDGLGEASKALTEIFDVVATQDKANCSARADVAVEGKVVLSAVPVTTLLFLEKQLVDIGTFVEKLPTLDPAESWQYDQAADCWATPAYQTTRTKKIPRNHVKAEATKEHPAQVEVYSEDVVVGDWTTTKFSGAVPAKERNDLLVRVRRLQEAVKLAREEANSQECTVTRIGEQVFGYLFS